MKTNIKVIATSLSLATSVGAVAGMGGLSVQSHLGQPFSGSIVVSGDEARAVIANGSVNVSGGLRASVIKQSEDRVIVRLRSTSPVREPVITFTVSAGRQTREYTAFIDPIRYTPKEAPTDEERKANRREQNMRQNQQRTQQQDFIERKRTVVERTRVTRHEEMFDDETVPSETVKAKKSSKVNVSSRRHRAQAGENLANIVERYRPRNMSQQTAMRALMLANPSAFKHGTTIRRNVTLYIPTESQWHAYAQRAQKQAMKQRAQQARQSRHVQGGSVSPTTIERNGVVEDVQPQQPVSKPEPVKPVTPVNTEASTPKAAPAKPVQTKPTQPVQPAKTASETATAPVSKPAEVKASETNKAVVDKNKADTASAVVAKASTPVAQPKVQPASTPQAKAASKSQAAASAVAGSAVVASSQVSAPVAPVARPKPAVRPPVVEEPVEEETDYMPFILGGVGAAVLGGAAFALSRRRKKGQADNANDEGEWEAEDNVGQAASSVEDEWGGDMDFGSSATKSSPMSSVKPTVIDDGAYFGDDEFSLDKYDSQSAFQAAPKSNANDEFSLDSKDEFSLDKFDSFDEVAPARKAPSSQDDEWSLPDSDVAQPQTASAQSNNEFVVADEDDWSLDKLDAITEFGKKQTPEQTFSLDDFVVDDIQPATVEKAAAAPVVETVEPVADEVEAFDFSDFETPTAAVSSSDNKVKDDEFKLDSFDDFAAPKVEQETHVEPVAEPIFDLDDFVVADKVEESVPATSSAVALDSFVEPVAVQSNQVVEEDLAFGLGSLEEFVLPETNQAEPALNEMVLPAVEDVPVQAQPVSNNDDLAFGLDAFEDFTLPESNQPESALNGVALPVAEDVPVQAQPVSNNDDLAFGLDAFEDFTLPESNQPESVLNDVALPVVETAPVQAQAASSDDDLAFGLDAFEDFVLPETAQAEKATETFDSLETFTEEVVVQSAPVSLSSNDDLGLNAFGDFAPASTSQPETASNLNEFAAFESFDESAVQNQAPAPSAAAPVFDDSLMAGLDDFVVAEINQAVASVKAQKANEDLDFGLAAFEDLSEPAVVAETPNAPQFDDLASLDTFAVEQTAVQATAPVSANNLTDDLSSGLDMFDDFTLPAQTAEVAPVVAEVAQVDDLASFNLADEVEAIVVPTVAEPAISFDAPAVAEPAISLEAPVVNVGFDDLALDVDLDSTTPVGLSQSTASVGMMDLTTGPLEQASSLDNVNLDTLEVIEDVQDWQQADNSNVGFVSGSVNDMTEPLEAKFELAKMYLEIDDAVAARETLRELISESSGAIQEQAKNLLADLGN